VLELSREGSPEMRFEVGWDDTSADGRDSARPRFERTLCLVMASFVAWKEAGCSILSSSRDDVHRDLLVDEIPTVC
jgi:hypothetical protein